MFSTKLNQELFLLSGNILNDVELSSEGDIESDDSDDKMIKKADGAVYKKKIKTIYEKP